VVAYLNRNPEIEGAYFDSQEDGWTMYGPTDEPLGLGSSIFNPFDPWDGYLWLGAGIALVVIALAALALGRYQKEPRSRVPSSSSSSTVLL
jgi:hypothetical protein